MKALFLLLGLSCGCYLGFYIPRLISIYIGLLSLTICLFSLFKKQGGYFIVPFCIGLLLNLIKIMPTFQEGTFSLLIIQRKENYVIATNFIHRFYIIDKGNNFEVGDFIKSSGNVKELLITTYEGKFSFKDYLARLGVRSEFGPKNFEYIFKNPIRIKTIEDIFLSSFASDEKALLSSLLFSRKDHDNSLISSFDSLSLLYLISTSGFLYSFIVRIFDSIVSRLCKEKTKEIIVLIFSIVIFFFCKSKIGCLRILLLRIFSLFARIRKMKFNYLEKISLVGCLVAFIDLHNVLQTGFILGFGLSISLFLLRPMIAKFKKWPRRMITFIFIRIFIFPFQLQFGNGDSHVFSFIFFYVFYPFVLILYLLGMFSLFFYPLNSPIKYMVLIIRKLLEYVSKVDFVISFRQISQEEMLTYFIVFAVIFILIDYKEQLVRNWIIGIYSFSIILSYIPLINYVSKEVCFINVGQGDSILIRDRNKSILIDTGGNLSFDMASDVLIPFLRRKRIYKLDALILTHGDFDHDGAKESLLSKLNVGSVLDNKEDFPYSVGSIRLENLNTYNLEGENESSLALYSEFLNKKWLFMGDTPKEVELNIIRDNPNLSCDILKVGHHGSKTSSCEAFLDQIKPTEAIISCGEKNKYGHPNKEVIDRLNSRKIKIRRTDKEGSICYFGFA